MHCHEPVIDPGAIVDQRMVVRMTELTARRVPFVHATVVRAEQPTSARPGDDAIIFADGTMEGFVGGQCARENVRTAALSTLTSGESLLLRVLPGGEESFPNAPGAKVTVNPCLSGGALEIFLDPQLPPAMIAVVGMTPLADATAALAELSGFAVVRTTPDQSPEGATAAVVCSLGDDEEQAVRLALDAGVDFISVVASQRRGRAMIDSLGLTDAELLRVHTPAGIEIGAQTSAEIALSILAQIVRAIRLEGLTPRIGTSPAPPRQAIDPICGMSVVVLPDTPHLVVDDVEHWFCNPGCRDRFAEKAAS
jgi:xanthine dehydrogenase accessory factor